MQEKIVGVQINRSIWVDNKKDEEYEVKLDSIVLEKHSCGPKCVLNTKEIKCKTEKQAFDLELKHHMEIQNNLNSVANPYLIYSVQCNDDGVRPCSSVYVKYGILLPEYYPNKIPMIIPEKCTTIRYDAQCTGLRETQWMTSDQMPKIKPTYMPDDIKLPQRLSDKSFAYMFMNCGFYFEESDFARAFRDDMLIQQALRRYALYGKIEKTW